MTTGAIAFAGLCPSFSAAAGATPTAPRQSIGLPAYFYPAGTNLAFWDQLRTGAPAVDVVIATGLRLETTTADTNYQAQIAQTRAAGVKVLAYVTTSSGNKPLATAKREIDRARAWYQVDGIFFDEAVRYPVTCGQVGYYKTLNAYAKALDPGAMTVINHGQILPECYVAVADVMMNAEMGASDYKAGWRPWGWEHKYPAEKFWHLVHSAPTTAEMEEVVRLSQARNAGRIFVTSAGMGSPGGPYGSLPLRDYWSAELEAVTDPPPSTATTLVPAPTTTVSSVPQPPPSTTTTTPAGTPTISSFWPTSGRPGSTVVINGSALSGVTMVTLNGGPATIVGRTDTSIVVTLASWSTTGRFWVNAPGGLSATSVGMFTVI